jgi:hypothetical protein
MEAPSERVMEVLVLFVAVVWERRTRRVREMAAR